MTDKKYPIGGYAPGNYQCKCCTCGSEFIGDKRAVQCEPCAVSEKERFDALSPSEQQELIKGNVEVFKKWYNTFPDSGEIDKLKAENSKMRQALEAHDEYAILLTDELNEILAYVPYGWKSARFDKGVELRDKIEALKTP